MRRAVTTGETVVMIESVAASCLLEKHSLIIALTVDSKQAGVPANC
jgi:hypothetical protein